MLKPVSASLLSNVVLVFSGSFVGFRPRRFGFVGFRSRGFVAVDSRRTPRFRVIKKKEGSPTHDPPSGEL